MYLVSMAKLWSPHGCSFPLHNVGKIGDIPPQAVRSVVRPGEAERPKQGQSRNSETGRQDACIGSPIRSVVWAVLTVLGTKNEPNKLRNCSSCGFLWLLWLQHPPWNLIGQSWLGGRAAKTPAKRGKRDPGTCQTCEPAFAAMISTQEPWKNEIAL